MKKTRATKQPKNTKSAELTVKALKQVTGGSKFYADNRAWTAGAADTLQ